MTSSRNTLFIVLVTSFFLITVILLRPDLTGMASYYSRGYVNLTIIPVASLVLVNDTIDFGSFYVNSSCGECYVDTNENYSSCCVGVENITEGFLIENQGNLNLSVQINVSANASGFIGGTNPIFQFLIRPDSDSTYGGQGDDTAASCNNQLNPSGWTNVTTATQYICGSASAYLLSPLNTRDEIVMHLKLGIPQNAIGKKDVSIIFTGTSS